jgi:hypothetical protein
VFAQQRRSLLEPEAEIALAERSLIFGESFGARHAKNKQLFFHSG